MTAFLPTPPLTGWGLTAQQTALDRVAELVDGGTVRTTLSTLYTPLDAAQLRRAHADVESGQMVGKVVVGRGE